ncbi:MAG: hypothetical protein QM758_11805 [Armatimonas sp.]
MELAVLLWKDQTHRYWLKEIIRVLWLDAPERLAPSLEAFWKQWNTLYGCPYFMGENHEMIRLLVQKAVADNDTRRIELIPFLTSHKSPCTNESSFIEFLVENINNVPAHIANQLHENFIKYLNFNPVRSCILHNIDSFPESYIHTYLNIMIKHIITNYNRNKNLLKSVISIYRRFHSEDDFRAFQQNIHSKRLDILCWKIIHSVRVGAKHTLDQKRFLRRWKWLCTPWPAPLEKRRPQLIKNAIAQFGPEMYVNSSQRARSSSA